MKLLIATFNDGKLNDYLQFCRGTNIEPVSLNDIGITEEFDEIHQTFEENAKAKAGFYYKLSGLPTLADDSGIEIPYWNMEPGVQTKRWGKNNDIGYIQSKIKEIPSGKRQGQMRAVLALCVNNKTYLSEGILKGTFTDKIYAQTSTKGYPWDKFFILDDNGKYYEELSVEENYKYNHRRIAFDKLKQYL